MNEWFWMNEWMNCIWEDLEYVWTLRPAAPKRSLKKKSLASLIFQRPLSFRHPFFERPLCCTYKGLSYERPFYVFHFIQVPLAWLRPTDLRWSQRPPNLFRKVDVFHFSQVFHYEISCTTFFRQRTPSENCQRPQKKVNKRPWSSCYIQKWDCILMNEWMNQWIN